MSKELYPISNYMSKLKEVYKGSDVIVNLCCYKLVSLGKNHVLEYLLSKNSKGMLCFPQYRYDYSSKTKTIKDFSQEVVREIFEQQRNSSIQFTGIKRYKGELYCFVKIENVISVKEEKTASDTFWFANMCDILDVRSLYMHKIDMSVTLFFYKHKEFIKLKDNDVPKTFYKKIKRDQLPPFLVFDYIHIDESSAVYRFSKKCPELGSGDIIVKYLYLPGSEKPPIVIISSDTENKDEYQLLKLNNDILFLEKNETSLKTNGRVNLNLYSYYVKNKTS